MKHAGCGSLEKIPPPTIKDLLYEQHGLDVSEYVNKVSTLYMCTKHNHEIIKCNICGGEVGFGQYNRFNSAYFHVIKYHWNLARVEMGPAYISIWPRNNYEERLSFPTRLNSHLHYCMLTGDLSNIDEELSLIYHDTYQTSDTIRKTSKLIKSRLTKCLMCGMQYECEPSIEIVSRHFKTCKIDVIYD